MVDEPNPSPQDLRDGPTDKHPGSILIAAANAVERSLEKLPVSVRVKIPPDYRFFNAIVDALRPFITKPAVVKDRRVDFPLADLIQWRRALDSRDGKRPHHVTLMNASAICAEIDEINGPLPAYGTDAILDWHPKNDPASNQGTPKRIALTRDQVFDLWSAADGGFAIDLAKKLRDFGIHVEDDCFTSGDHL